MCVCVCVLNLYFALTLTPSLRCRNIFYFGTLLLRLYARRCVCVVLVVLVDVRQCCYLLTFVCLLLFETLPLL